MPLNTNLKLDTSEKKKLFDTYKNKETYDTIFNSEDNLRLISLDGNNIFYGKVDKHNNPVMVNPDFLSTVDSRRQPVRMCDVAAKAFRDMQNYFKDASDVINQDSKFYDLKAAKGYSSLNAEYVNYLTNLHNYIFSAIDNKTDKSIKNIEDYFSVFVEICTHLVVNQELPLTRSGFLLSSFCSPYASGLIVDLDSANFEDDQSKYDSYVRDDNFNFFLETATRFNFLVDKNAPWRLVFDISSKNLLTVDPFEECGVIREKGYFKQFNIDSLDDFFNKRYYKTMLGATYVETTELYSLKNIFLQMYNTLIVPNQEFIYAKEKTSDRSIQVLKFVRDVYSDTMMNDAIKDDKWLRFLLYFRALESKQKWNQIEFDRYYSKTMIMYKNYGIRQAIDFINACTRDILDVDNTKTRLQNRQDMINKIKPLAEGFRF
jgi:hypothetical protein